MHINDIVNEIEEIEELAQDTLFDILEGEYESAKEKLRSIMDLAKDIMSTEL